MVLWKFGVKSINPNTCSVKYAFFSAQELVFFNKSKELKSMNWSYVEVSRGVYCLQWREMAELRRKAVIWQSRGICSDDLHLGVFQPENSKH